MDNYAARSGASLLADVGERIIVEVQTFHFRVHCVPIELKRSNIWRGERVGASRKRILFDNNVLGARIDRRRPSGEKSNYSRTDGLATLDPLVSTF